MTAIEEWANAVEWTEIGSRVVLPEHRATFFGLLYGEEVGHSQEWEGEGMKWRSPNGSFPFTPGHNLKTIVDEFEIRGITAVSHNLAWIAHDTTHQPGYFGDFSGTYQILGVRTAWQVLVFLDHNDIYPIVIIDLPERAERIEEEAA